MSSVRLPVVEDEEIEAERQALIPEGQDKVVSTAITADDVTNVVSSIEESTVTAGQQTRDAVDETSEVIDDQPTSLLEESASLLGGEQKDWSTGLFERIKVSGSGVSNNASEFGDILNLIPLTPPDSCCMTYNVSNLRTSLRKLFNIKGTSLGDTCASLWCMSCSLAQMKREVLSKISSGSLPDIMD